MESLVKKARDGDADAFSELITGQMQNMYKAARSILNNEEDVADAISDTILICWEKLKQLKEARYFRTWMTRILINECNRIYREKEKNIISEYIPEAQYQESGFANFEWLETLKGLDERYRTVIILYYVEGFKTAEIAEILDIPEATVRTRLSRSKEKVAKIYGIESARRKSI